MRKVLTMLLVALSLVASASARAEEAPAVDEVSPAFWSKQLNALKTTPMPPGQRWWEVVERDLKCGTVYDGCRTCTSGDCSPVPTACAPAEWKCIAPGK